MFSMDGLINLFLLVIAILNFGLGFLVYLRGRKSKVNVSYALVSLFASLWIFGQLIMRESDSMRGAKFGAELGYFSAIFIPTFLVYFSYIFPSPDGITSWKKSFLWFTSLIIAGITLFPNFMILGLKIHPWGKEVILGWPYHIYSVYFLLFIGWSLYILFSKYKRSSSLERIQLKYVLAGLFPTSTFGLTFNLILPWFGNYRLIWLGPLFTIVMIVTIAYAIQKHHLMNVRVIATELFTGLIIFIFFIQLFLTKNTQEFILNLGMLILIIIFGYFLIKGTLREVDELRRLSEAKSEFVSIASHQLRSPLTAIKGYVSMLTDGSFGAVDERAKEILRKVYLSNERLIKLVEDLLDISKIEEGKLEFIFQEVDICDIIQTVVDEFSSLVKEKGFKISFERPFDLPKIKADETKIRQVILNLIDNAIKYTNDGYIEIAANQKSKIQNPKQKVIIIKIKDTGVGMTNEEIGELFEKFHRGVEIPKIHTEGTGLGLYVAKKIVEAHKGKIWAESEGKGKGSTFYVELPI